MLLVMLMAGAGQATAAQDPAAACRTCHQGPMALDRWSQIELVERITKIRDGAMVHPPLGVAPPDDARVEALAQALAGPPAQQ